MSLISVERLKRANCFCNIAQLRLIFTDALSSGDKRKYYEERRILGYTQKQMFEVAIAVDKYKYFVPWCNKSDIERITPAGAIIVNLGVGFYPISENYSSIVTFSNPDFVTSVATNTRLFHHLINNWKFLPAPSDMPKCSILEFSVDFEFRSLLHSHFAMLFFDHVVTTMVNAFLDRSQQLYGLEAIPRQKPQILKYRK